MSTFCQYTFSINKIRHFLLKLAKYAFLCEKSFVMAVLEVLHFPDPRLRVKAEPVTRFDQELQSMIVDMYETMYANHGVGLAATQVNIHKQIFVMDVSESRDQPITVINPVVIKKEGVINDQHGCLSVPGIPGDNIPRSAVVHLKGLDENGKPIELTAEETMAICVQHEMDHLNGMLYIDHLSPLKRERIRKKLLKHKRRA